MTDNQFNDKVLQIVSDDPRYAPEAYGFLREALDFTARQLDKPESGPKRHISARELMEGVRVYSLREFGPMTLTVLNTWGLQNTEDIGAIVFNLVEAGVLGKNADDSIDDFRDGFDFISAFDTPFCAAAEHSPDVGTATSNPRKAGKGSAGRQ